jgi:hypothetical protein
MAKNVRVKSADLGAKDPVQAKGLAEGNPHYYGHREAGTDALTDYELL